MQVYQPAEDSYLFAEFLRKYLLRLPELDISYLDMGTGSGILGETALDIGVASVMAADINPDAVIAARKKDIEVVKSYLFSNVEGKFDLITFNAPYLPEDDREPTDSRVATTGGKNGDEISVRFLTEAKKHLNENGKIFLLVSSLTPMDKINEFKPVVVSKTGIFGEELIILEIR